MMLNFWLINELDWNSLPINNFKTSFKSTSTFLEEQSFRIYRLVSEQNFHIKINEPVYVSSEEDTLNTFNDVLNTDYLSDCDVNKSAQMYTAGYGFHSASKNLIVVFMGGCWRKWLFRGNGYFYNLKRESIANVKMLFFHIYAIFEATVKDLLCDYNVM